MPNAARPFCRRPFNLESDVYTVSGPVSFSRRL